jgi:recombinase/recombinase-like zinc beta ribbon protein
MEDTVGKRAVGIIRLSRVKGREDDLFRSPEDQRERISKLSESNGWRLSDKAAERFTGGVLAQAARFVRDSNAEKARAAQVEAVEAGIWMSPAVPPGYVLAADRRLTPDPVLAPVVRKAFEMRAGGARLEEVRDFFHEHGVERTRKGIDKLLHSRVVLGELHFGELHNPDAYPAIVDRATWERVQRTYVSRGRQPKSRELLARLGVLHCGTCGGRMSVTTSNYRYRAYRCGNAECERRVTVSGRLVEGLVRDYVKWSIAHIRETAHAGDDVQAAIADEERAQRAHAAAVKVLDPQRPGRGRTAARAA